MKALVIGGSGFLGSHVADCLTESGYEVIIYDIRESVHRTPQQKMILGSITDENAVSEAMKDCDFVFHLAGIADLDSATTRPLDTITQNIMGAATVLETALKNKIKHFIYASTIYVYSDKGGFYKCSKQAAETYIEEYGKKYGLKYTILRFGTLYGPRADKKNSIFRYIKQAMESGNIDCSGSGDELREYIHIRDAAKLAVQVLEQNYDNHITITGHYPLKFRDMLNMLNEILGNSIQIRYENKENDSHYNITPYSFVPRTGKKLTSNCYVDMGQGLLECVNEIYALNDVPENDIGLVLM